MGSSSRASLRAAEARGTTSDVVGVAVGTLFEKLRSWSMERVRQVNNMTSTEVLAAGDALSEIVAQSRSYVEHMRRVMGNIAGGDEGQHDGGIHAIDRQGRMLTDFIASLTTGLERQDAVARQALDQLVAVRRAGAHMLTVSNQARMLAVNASIEASRLAGDSGSAFGVIASEMSAFAKNMQKQSDEIVSIVDGLTRSLPKIAEQAGQLRVDTEGFRADFEKQNLKVSSVVASLQATVAESLREGDDRVAKILSLSQEGLSHLQFQDPCAQRLLQIEADILRVQTCANEVIESGDDASVGALDSASAHRDVSAGHVMVFDDATTLSLDGEAALAAGEVLLF